MADIVQIESELRDFLDKESNISQGEKIVYLMAIIKKHMEIEKIDHIVDYHDFENLISQAKSEFVRTKIPMNISNKEINYQESAQILLLDAFIGYLNKHKILRRLVKFDHYRR